MENSLDINSIRASVAGWLEAMTRDVEPGRFRFCGKGSLVPLTGKAALFTTCFAVKIAWQAGLWDEWSKQQQMACLEFIRSFQEKDGYFRDQWLLDKCRLSRKDYLSVIIGRTSLQDLRLRQEQVLRAETRQAVSTLLMIGEQALHPMPCEITTPDGARRFVDALGWKNPWSAGSHVSHQLFMLTVNNKFHQKAEDNYNLIIDSLLEALNHYYHVETGTWYSGNPSNVVKINGAMKVLSGLQWLQRPYPDTTSLINFALKQPFEQDGCGFLNRLFVVWQARKGVPEGYRQQDIAMLAHRVLDMVQGFKQKDGAFSFYQGHSQTSYLGARISRGLPVSDLHGTVMLTWAIAIALDLLRDDAPIGADLWHPHKA